jgi:hypothetical protein
VPRRQAETGSGLSLTMEAPVLAQYYLETFSSLIFLGIIVVSCFKILKISSKKPNNNLYIETDGCICAQSLTEVEHFDSF